jgi:arylsulfatase
VSQQYKNPGKFVGGTIQAVAFDVSEKAYVDLNRDAEADFATD